MNKLSNKTSIHVTRISNACVLIEFGGHAILTDPFFVNWKMIGIKEEVAVEPEALPPLTAIIGCHDFIDHWQMVGLKRYPHNKDDVRVFVAMESQAKSARKVGFRKVEVLKWGESRRLEGGLSIESVPAQKMMRWTVNNYVLRAGDSSVFFGSEARDLAPLKAYSATRGEVDIALLPTNAVHLFGYYKLVMSGQEAVTAAQTLGAASLVVIHDSHPVIPGLIHIKSSGKEAVETAKNLEAPGVEVIRVPTGVRWTSRA